MMSLLRYLFNSYTMATRDLPDIYAQARGCGHIYQTNRGRYKVYSLNRCMEEDKPATFIKGLQTLIVGLNCGHKKKWLWVSLVVVIPF